MLERGGRAGRLVGAIVVLAIGEAVFQPALQAVLPSLVNDVNLLPASNGLLDATDRSARLIGPGLVALLAGVVPMVHFLTIDAVSFLASATALLLISRRVSGAATISRRQHRETIRDGIVRGYRATAAHPLLAYLLATAGPLDGAWFAVFYLALPLLIAAHDTTAHNGLGAYGLVLSAYGCTNLAANLIFGSRVLSSRPQFQMFGGNLLVGCGITLVGFAGLLPGAWQLPGFAAAAAVAAVGGPMKDIPLAVLRQIRLCPADMAAAMRVTMAMASCGTLIAMLITPTAIGLLGTVPVIVGCGLVYLAVGVVGLVRHVDWVETVYQQPA